ncbi:MAG: hypothetical protein ACRD1Y_00970 [Terriglobales bacterium]
MTRENGNKGASQRVQGLLLAQFIEPARRRRQGTVRVVAGDIVRSLQLRNCTPLVCTAMQAQRFLRQNQLEVVKVEGPPSGQSTTVAVTYRVGDSARGGDLFHGLRGILREAFATEGGGEKALKRDRERFDRNQP